MFEKLLLAGTITFSLNFFIGMSAQSAKPPTTFAQVTPQSISIATALHNSPLLRSLFQ